jgi:hypothetical protein
MSKRLVLLVSGFLMLFTVIAYATTMTVNIEPNKEGVIDKLKKVNVVVKLTSDFVIDTSQIVIEWNGQDITETFLGSASSQLNDSKTEITFYWPISAADLEPGQHTISATTGNGKWYDSNLIIQAVDDNSLHFSYSIPVLLTNPIGSTQLKKAVVQSSSSPSISNVYGESIWNYHNCWNKSNSPGTYIGYAQVPYKGRNDSGIGKIIAQGSNLDKITSVTIQEGDYTVVGIQKIGTTQLKLDIRVNYVGERYPIPVTNSKLVFTYSGGTITKTVNLLPTFYKDNQSWGQCTWYAGLVMRIKNNKSEVRSYSSTTTISGDPNSSGFPQKGSVLNASDAHMAYLENITLKKTVKNSDGSTSYTYTLTGTQYNAKCDVSKSSFSTDMVTKKSKSGAYSITTYPTVVYKVTKIKQ